MKQKQVQNVKIVIGETKPKRKPRRRAPVRRAPPAGAPPRPGGGGAGGGGPLPFPPPPPPGIPSNLPFPQLFPSRAGPAVESQAQLQQLVKPLEQSLLRLEQQIRAPQALPALPAPARDEGKEEERISMRDLQDYVARYYDAYAQPESSLSSKEAMAYEIREIETQTEEPVRVTIGTQTQIDEPPRPLVEAGQKPLIDAVVQPHEEKIMIDEEDLLSITDLQRLRRQGGITENFLAQFTLKQAPKRGHNIFSIAKALGIVLPKNILQRGRKQETIDYILDNL